MHTNTYTNAYTQTYINICTYTHTHTYTHIHTYTVYISYMTNFDSVHEDFERGVMFHQLEQSQYPNNPQYHYALT